MFLSKNHGAETDLLIKTLPHPLVANYLIRAFQCTDQITPISSCMPKRKDAHSLLLILDPTTFVAQTHQLPDLRLHRVRQPIPFPRRMRLLSPPARVSRAILMFHPRVVSSVVHRCPWRKPGRSKLRCGLRVGRNGCTFYRVRHGVTTLRFSLRAFLPFL